jgi:hypothetical protein
MFIFNLKFIFDRIFKKASVRVRLSPVFPLGGGFPAEHVAPPQKKKKNNIRCLSPPPQNTVCMFEISTLIIGIPTSKPEFRSRNRNSVVEIGIEIPMLKSKPR